MLLITNTRGTEKQLPASSAESESGVIILLTELREVDPAESLQRDPHYFTLDIVLLAPSVWKHIFTVSQKTAFKCFQPTKLTATNLNNFINILCSEGDAA